MDKRHRLAAAYEALRSRVAEILRAADPVKLIALGAPDDEYDPEIGTIIPRLRSVAGPDETLRVLHEEFCHWFGERVAGPRESYRSPAQAIWLAWEQFRKELR